MTTRPEQERIEAQLRAEAPVLRPELRRQVLARCREERRTSPTRIWHWRQGLVGALASIILFCWIGSSSLDARSRAIIAGNNERQPGNSLAVRDDLLQKFGAALRWRMREMALLLHEQHNG